MNKNLGLAIPSMKYLLLISCLVPGLLFGQSRQSVIEFDPESIMTSTTFPELKKDGKVFPILNSDSTGLMLLLSTTNKLVAVHLDENLEEITTLETELPETRELTKLDGGFFGDGNYYAFYSDRKKTNFSAFRIDLEKGTIYSTNFNLFFKKEKYLHSFFAGGYYYIATVPIYSSIVKIYRINDQLRSRETAYDFSDVSFDGTNPTLFNEINEYIIKGNHRLSRISLQDPITTAATASFFKVYHDDTKLRITFDHVIGTTTVLEMELNSRLKSVFQVQAPEYVLRSGYAYTSNSVVWEDYLLNFIIGDDGMSIVIHDLSTGDELHEFNFGKNDTFDLINGPLIIDGEVDINPFPTVRDFLKLVEGNKVGIALCEQDDSTWELSFGAAKTPGRDLTDQVMVTIGLEEVEDTSSPTYLAFTNNELSKLALAKSIIDNKTFEKVDENLKYQIFDEIDDFKATRLTGFEVLETVFKMGNSYYLGNYYSDQRKYVITRFEELP